ncbi:MAG: amidohydrolase family protein, partial [Sulfolobaceae archaeon]|nr:amidohydrolase family protein [Sulfolobaceae archaeon]
FIIAHAGRPIWYQTAFYLARMFSNAYLEISSITPKNLLNVLPRLMEIEDKVIYGSDFPSYAEQDLAEYAEEAYRVTKSEKIMRDNALRLIFRER